MPANLPPQYFEAEKRYRLARTPQEKILALEEMLRIMPKHKGTERLQGELRKKIARLRQESRKKSSTAKRGLNYHVEKVGAGQVALVGPPNSGKSSLLATLTNASPEIADYPFTTRLPLAGMMQFENIQIQLVDLPPISPGFTEAWVFSLVRNADALWLVIDLSQDDLLEGLETLLQQLEEAGIRPIGTPSGENYDEGLPKRSIIVGTKLDLPGAGDNAQAIEDLYEGRFPLIPVSTHWGDNLKALGEKSFRLLNILRAYTKAPGKEPDLKEPVILPTGSTVMDFALQIHKDFASKLKFARVWGKDKHAGQRVQRDYTLSDGDVVELHI